MAAAIRRAQLSTENLQGETASPRHKLVQSCLSRFFGPFTDAWYVARSSDTVPIVSWRLATSAPPPLQPILPQGLPFLLGTWQTSYWPCHLGPRWHFLCPFFPNRAELFCLPGSFPFSCPFFLPVHSWAALWLQWFCHLKPQDLYCGSALVLWHTLASVLLHVYRPHLLEPCCVESTLTQVTSQECGKSSSCVFPGKCIKTCRLLLLSYQAKRYLH